jgi:hypothetical protein
MPEKHKRTLHTQCIDLIGTGSQLKDQDRTSICAVCAHHSAIIWVVKDHRKGIRSSRDKILAEWPNECH